MNKLPIIGAAILLLFLAACSSKTKKEYSKQERFFQERFEARKSIVLIKNDGDFLPLKKLEKKQIACVNIGINDETEFEKLYSASINVIIKIIGCTTEDIENELINFF